tara:strand:+ start:979 stop:4938 length:3960 start_codon:yes stop_codon:yes gene_type:complete
MVHTILNVDFPSKNYLNAKNSKYTLAVNITSSGVNNYTGFKSFFEINTLLTNVNNSNIKRKCLFEVIKTDGDVKPYFDIDKSNFTHDEFNKFLNVFLEHFNIFFKTRITLNDVLVYIRDDTSNKLIVKSSHIIINNHKINYKLIPIFIEYFERITERKYITENDICVIDKAIYTPNRIFCLPYNTKLKYIEQDLNNPKYFIPYKEQTNNISDYFISYTETIDNSLKDNGEYKLFNILSIINHNQLRNAFNKLKNHKIDTTDTTDKPIVKCDEVEITNLNCICETIEHLINYLPKDFYTNNTDWVLITKILKRHGLSDGNVKKWLKHSSLITNENWTYKANDTWYKKVDISTIWFGIPKFLNIVAPYLYHNPINFYNDMELVKYIQSKSNNSFDETELIDILTKSKYVIEYAINKNTFELNERYKYNYKTGFLYNNDLIIGNYYYDIGLNKLYQNVKLEDTIIIEDINDMKQISIDFINNIEVILACKAKWGSGKTFVIVKNSFEEAKRQNRRCVFITENNALNRKYTAEFDIQSHLTTKNIDNELSIACSTESLNKITINETDIIILDEFETILSHYESDTFREQAFKKFLLFKDAVVKVNKIIVLDADLSKDRLNLLTDIKGGIKINPYDIKTNNFKDYKFNMYVNETAFINTIINEALKQGSKLVIPSSSKEFNKNIVNEIHNRDKTKTILKIDSDGALLIKDGNINKAEIENLEDFIVFNDVDIFCYSPSIKTGISINQEYFNKCYGYAHNKSCNIREFIQMLFRARQLKDKEINTYLNGGFKQIRKFIDINRIGKVFLNPIMTYYTSKIFNGSFDTKEAEYKDIVNYDTAYLKLKLLNETENYNSSSRFNQDFVMRLKYAHDIQLNYIDTIVELDEADITDYMLDDKIIDFVNCELVDLNTFNNLTESNWLMRAKYNFFYKTYYIEGITNQVVYNKDIYDMVNNEMYYKTYLDKATLQVYNNLKKSIGGDNDKYLNKPITDIQIENEFNIGTHKTEIIDLGNKPKKVVKSVLIITLLEHLGINLLKIPFTISNKDLNDKIDKFKFNGFLTKLKQYYENNEVETKFIFNPNDKKFINNMKEIIKSLLASYDITFKYVNHKNTTRDFDKLIFNYNNFNSRRDKFEGRLKCICDFKLPVNQVEKVKNTYRYMNTITDTYYKCFKTNNPEYFNTYDVRIPINLKKLKEAVIKQTDKTKIQYRSGEIEINVKYLHDKAVLIELHNYLYNKHKPYIKSNANYKTIQNKRICEAIEMSRDKTLPINKDWETELNKTSNNFNFIRSEDFNQKVNNMLRTEEAYKYEFDEIFLQEESNLKKSIK